MKVACYVRVSRDDQVVDQQVEPMVARCRREGWEFEVFSDVGESGAKSSRPQLDRMMTAIRLGSTLGAVNRFDAVMVWRLDRLGRSLKHLMQLVEEFSNKKVKFICFAPDIDTETASGRFFLQIMGAVAELEREMIRDRINARIASMRLAGKHVGRLKGSRDKTPRKRVGYWLRWANKKASLPKLATKSEVVPVV
jgi:DNA invertase Pin-like site-specific DNA recombinase